MKKQSREPTKAKSLCWGNGGQNPRQRICEIVATTGRSLKCGEVKKIQNCQGRRTEKPMLHADAK